MAGTLTISTLSDGTNSTSATNPIKGSAKAWVNFNGTGTVAIRDSFNVSSITDNGTGKYVVNFTTAMPNANYSANVSVSSMPGVSDANLCVFDDSAGARSAPTTTALRVSTYNAQFAYLDIEYIRVTVFSS
jgi:hypothetical protein